MNKSINQFIDRTRQLSKPSFVWGTSAYGSNNSQALMLDLYKSAALLNKAKAENKLDEQIDEVVGVLHVAQAMNVIGYEDLEELMVLLENIRKESLDSDS